VKKENQPEFNLSNPAQPPTLTVSGYNLAIEIARLRSEGATVEGMSRVLHRNSEWELKLWWPS
jgi:hypothetical protein